MFDWLYDLIRESPATYPIEAGAVTLDGFFPVVPGETVIITAAIVAAGGGLSIVLVFLAGWAGAFAGDNISYLLGAKVGRPAARRLFTGDRSKRVLAWAQRLLRQRGPIMIIAARFVPGGRTAVTFTSGMLDMKWRRFALADLVGAGIWAGYATALGWFGGAAFKDSLWKPLAISLGLAALVAVIGEVVRRFTESDADEDAEDLDVDEILGRESSAA